MKSVEIKKKIAELIKKGFSIARVATQCGVSWSTARKYAKFCAVSTPKFKRHILSRVEVYRAEIDRLIALNGSLGKQRLTGKRMFEILKERHPDIPFGLRTFHRFLKENGFKVVSVASVPLCHSEGDAQIDFGAAKYYENGVLHDGRYLVLSLPYSGTMFAVLLPSENRQCLMHALIKIFKYIGGVPKHIRIDNASSMVNRGKTYCINDEFQAFADFYGFEIERCNPARGNEKGSVERAVSTVRQNFLSPPPHFKSLNAFNDDLLCKCKTLNGGKRYGTNRLKKDLLGDDLNALMQLPEKDFNAVTYTIRRSDKCAIIEFDGHRYSVSSDHPCETIIVEAGAFSVTLFTEDGNFVCRHDRCYTERDSIDLSSYRESFVESPRALYNCGITSKEEMERIARLSKTDRRAEITKKFDEVFGVIDLRSYRLGHEKYKDLFSDE